ncbi:MAG: SMC-Scp complex subunit ScpB [Pseudomonadota bacterium]
MLEAILFASSEPLGIAELGERMPDGTDIEGLVQELQSAYAARGVNLVRVAGKWAFRTAEDLGFLLQHEAIERRKLSRAAIETLAIIAYHQPVTRAEIEEIRGVSTSKGTIDVLLETGWINLKGRRKTPGKPVTYGTSEAFLIHFGLAAVSDLPGLEELKQTGLLDLSPEGSERARQGQLFDPMELADRDAGDDGPDEDLETSAFEDDRSEDGG